MTATDAALPPIPEHTSRPWWTHVLRFILCVVIFASTYVAFGLAFGFDRMHADWYPIDNSRVATNVVAGFVQVGVAATLTLIFYRPASSWLRARFHHHLGLALAHHREHQRVERQTEHDALHERLGRMEAKQNHIILSTDGIENHVPGVAEEHQPEAAAIIAPAKPATERSQK